MLQQPLLLLFSTAKLQNLSLPINCRLKISLIRS